MSELTLNRSDDDRNRYVLDGVGEITRHGLFKTAATLRATDGREWHAARRGLMGRVDITDSSGSEAARFSRTGTFKRGGQLIVGGATYGLEPSAMLRERYALIGSAGEEIATVAAGGWSGVKITVETHDAGQVDPLVLLTACWLVRQFADDSGASSATTSAATTG